MQAADKVGDAAASASAGEVAGTGEVASTGEAVGDGEIASEVVGKVDSPGEAVGDGEIAGEVVGGVGRADEVDSVVDLRIAAAGVCAGEVAAKGTGARTLGDLDGSAARRGRGPGVAGLPARRARSARTASARSMCIAGPGERAPTPGRRQPGRAETARVLAAGVLRRPGRGPGPGT